MNNLAVQFDGVEIHPATVDALLALEVVSSYLALLSSIARVEGQSLSFTGIEILDKCTLFKTVPSEPLIAESAAHRAMEYLTGARTPPPAAEDELERMLEALERLPGGYETTASLGDWKQPLNILRAPVRTRQGTPVTPMHSDGLFCTLSVRAVPIQVAGRPAIDGADPADLTDARRYARGLGGDEPGFRAWFRSGSEAQPFSLEVTREQAQELGSKLCEEVDIVALVTRSEHGLIQEGTLREIHRLGDGPPRGVWEAWFRASAGDWDAVKEVVNELGRH